MVSGDRAGCWVLGAPLLFQALTQAPGKRMHVCAVCTEATHSQWNSGSNRTSSPPRPLSDLDVPPVTDRNLPLS